MDDDDKKADISWCVHENSQLTLNSKVRVVRYDKWGTAHTHGNGDLMKCCGMMTKQQWQLQRVMNPVESAIVAHIICRVCQENFCHHLATVALEWEILHDVLIQLSVCMFTYLLQLKPLSHLFRPFQWYIRKLRIIMIRIIAFKPIFDYIGLATVWLQSNLLNLFRLLMFNWMIRLRVQ